MIKRWKVTAEIFWDASKEETVIVKANTEKKAIEFAIEKIKKKFPKINDMIKITKVKEV